MRLLVTGGGGFLGKAICTQLRARGYEVISFSRSRYPDLDALGVQQRQGDLADLGSVAAAFQGLDAVFHVAAKAGAWGGFDAYFDANVRGTQNVIAACRMHGIGTLIHTSTPSVAHHGTRPVMGEDEASVGLARNFKAWYPATKRVAEERALEANGPGLATVALRPRLIWGPGDNNLLPRLAERAQAGRLRFVGDGRNLIDTTYVDNAARAHLDAFDALHGNPHAACAGKAYFISNGEPRPLAEIINQMLHAYGAPRVTRFLPFPAAYAIGALMELAWSLLPLKGDPLMTRFLAEQLATPHYYDISAARRDFGYQPDISLDEGLRRLRVWSQAQVA